ncbi:GntR family transcriptional regulator [Salinicoccus sp. ID82-1]|uniref:GntR family transcriptional regulator n=1 Tax=Salinicoccus sp. ID82-1 TaxID=2820269 RepID=UPI001F48C2AA|nr:GntR family transcriptional regulator [Salinicoccus sp. ID82-1]MCG1008834.1 GntR family transcriptional regulator [Salinicoccus sp. ID82-1]
MLLKDIAYDRIKQKILNEEYTPGKFLSERTLIEDLDMSKTPIKNALIRLETEGFLTVSSKQGIFINELSVDKINDMYNLRIALETFNCKFLHGRITEYQLDELKQILDVTKEVTDNLDINSFATYDHEFHLAISNMAGNMEITEILINRQDHLRRITLKHLRKDPERVKIFYQDHLQIYEALKAHQAESVHLMEQHLENSKSILFR